MKLSKQSMRFTLGMFSVIGFFSVITALIFITIPATNSDIIKIMAGYLSGVLSMVVGFYFGDSDSRPGT